ncbi:MAG: lysophospholipid acyltransferase family protein [Desulfobacteraceae bacterium]|nr:lysophospholipid acyltransferase family protein [Desulfobacteraceae bacterium]MBC2755247.1 lysophospholipid acyltransferase family protein [Desulfobacteraceae bacterium]
METILFKTISGLFYLIGLISRNTAVKIADFLGGVWFVVDKRHRDVALENLTHVFGSEKSAVEIRKLARRIFRNLILIIFEIGWLLRLKEKEFSKYFHVNGLHYLKNAHKKGKGVLVLTGHMGNWELMSMAAAMLGYPMSAIYRPMDFKPLDLFFINLRGRYGTTLYPKKNAMRPILRGLKKGELIGILLDQNTNVQSGVFVDFFNRKACTNKGLALIALGTDTPVVPLFLLREEDGYRVEIGPEVPVIRTGDKEKDIITSTRQYNRVIEDVICRYPDQWFWVHRRWKTQIPSSQQV